MITDTAPASAPNKSEWTAEIHTPDQTYNANVPINLIERDPANRVPTQDAIWALAATIKIEGLLQPIVLRQLADGTYRIIAGETRWCAFRFLSRETIPAFIRQGEADAAGDTAKRLVENLSRTDISPIAEARGFKLLSEQGRTQKQIGELFGRSQPVVANAIRVLALPNSILEMIEEGKLSMAHGVSLARFAAWPEVVGRIARLIGPSGWSAKNIDASALPFADTLVLDGFAVRIPLTSSGGGRCYVISPALAKEPGFFLGQFVCHYLKPSNPAEDKWVPERNRQDAILDAGEKKQSAKEEAQKKSGRLTPEQIERKRTLEKNKRIRAENAASLAVALEKLQRTPEPTSLLLAVIVERALGGYFGSGRIQAAADAVGVRLPKGMIDLKSLSRGLSVESLQALSAVDLSRLAVAAIITKEVDDADRNASKLPDNVERVMNSKVPSGAPAAADLGTVVEFEKDPQRRAIWAKQASKKSGGAK